MDNIIIDTKLGKIKGLIKDNFYFFRGIPYIETKRFCKPEIIKKFDNDFFDGTVGETDCYQANSFYEDKTSFYAKEFRSNIKYNYDEDFMTLNIITPNNVGSRPVLVFFHGGGFESGTVGDLPYGDTTEYAKRDIVFVSVGYRLNVFGLYGGTNYGLYDLISSIDFIKENISSFGGNPSNITIIGQSAGAMSIMDLLCSDYLKGKINGAIMMSGAGVVPHLGAQLTKKKVQDFWNKISSEIDVFNCSPKELYDSWRKNKDSVGYVNGFKYMQPCIDGDILKDTQKNIVKKDKYLDIPIMIGLTSQDCIPFFIYGMALRLGLILNKKNHQPVYGYFFDRILPGKSYKAFHAADLWYVFGNLEKSWRPFEKVDYELSEKMIDNVASFASNHKPLDINWINITRKTKGFKLFDGVNDSLVYPKECRKKMLKTTLYDHGPI